MALFQIFRGAENNLPSEKRDGLVYFCIDTGNMYIDCPDQTGNISRFQISANYANKIRYLSGSEYVEISAEYLSSAVSHIFAQDNPHGVTPAQIGAALASHDHNTLYYSKNEIDTLELIAIEDIDTICGSSIVAASEVVF